MCLFSKEDQEKNLKDFKENAKSYKSIKSKIDELRQGNGMVVIPEENVGESKILDLKKADDVKEIFGCGPLYDDEIFYDLLDLIELENPGINISEDE
jgi:hypothetical protein